MLYSTALSVPALTHVPPVVVALDLTCQLKLLAVSAIQDNAVRITTASSAIAFNLNETIG
jgi:hypothetical protein